MVVHKEFIDKIILRRNVSLSELVGKEGLNLKAQAKDVGDLIDPLDQIFYTIECLEKMGLIECEKRGRTLNDDLFALPFDDNPDKIYQVMHLHDLWKGAAGWIIKMKPGLINFKQGGYRTHEQPGKEKSVGILNEGKNTTIVNNEFYTDVGIVNKGSGLSAVKNKFFKQGESKQSKNSIWSKLLWQVFVAIIVILFCAYITFLLGWNK